MATPNPHTISWANPTTNTDGTPYNAATDNAGYELVLDGAPAVSIPVSYGTSFDLSTLAAFTALKSGSHTAALAVVNKQGVVSDFSAQATFLLAGTPSAPTAVAVA